MECKCTAPGFCQFLNRQQTAEHFNICQGNVREKEKADVIRRNWLKMAGHHVDPDFCPHRGLDIIRTETCHVCGNRGKPISVYECSIYGSCSLTQHHIGQTEKVCKDCPSRPKPLKAVWDKKLSGFLPSLTNQNFNCSIIEYAGKTLLAYRHNWGSPNIVLCELDRNWKPLWNERIVFPYRDNNVFQEDPRLFIYQDQLHVAFTAVRTRPKLVARVGYASLSNKSGNNWRVENCYVPEYGPSDKWEKNWGFFESQGKLWCVYDAKTHTIFEVDKGVVTPSYKYKSTILNVPGEIRGGASPQFWRGSFYSFIHFRTPPKNYSGGLYTFDSQPPFEPTGYIPYSFLNPNKEHCTNDHASQVVYPAGAIIKDWRWVISYGAYDRDSRLAAYDVNEIEHAIVKRKK